MNSLMRKKNVHFKNHIVTIFSFLILCNILTDFSSCSTEPPRVESIAPPVKNEAFFYKRYDDPEINEVISSGWKHYNGGRFEMALFDFERLISKGYSHYDILFGAGLSAMGYYNQQKAITYLSQCIQQRPDHFEAYYFRAQVYRQLRDYAHARADLEKILSTTPVSDLLCGLYPKDKTNSVLLEKRKNESRDLLASM